jgi:Tol biopolymer transport system component
VQLTNDPNTAALAPSWSSDGKRVAFYTSSGKGTGEIIAIDANGTNATSLTNAGSDGYDPAWSLGDTPDSPAPVVETSTCFRDGDFEDAGCVGGSSEK